MPGLDGIALALKVASAKPDMKILMMSGYAAERQRAHNLDVLIHRVIAKPFTLREICDAVDETLGLAS
jgi:two-component system cell cycle response regulator CpdR